MTKSKKIQDKKIQSFNKILEMCEEPKSIKEIMLELGYKSMPSIKRDYIKPLIESQKLKMTIPGKPTSKNQKYVINA